MTAAPVQGLHDIALPPAIAWWPPAPGWWLVGALLLLLVARALLALWRRHRRNAYRRAARRALRALAASAAPPADIVLECQRLLRRCCLAICARGDVVRAQGEGWVVLLRRLWPHAPGDAALDALLRDGAYRPPAQLSAADAERMLAFAHGWLRGHRRVSGLQP